MAQSRGLMRGAVAVAAAMTLFAAPAMAAERLVIPFELSEMDHMLVKLEINGGTMTTGVVDTAATFAMIDSRTARNSGVVPPGANSPLVNVLGVNGERMYPIVQLDKVKLGNLNLNALKAAYAREIDIPGTASNVLPASALPGDVLQFDFRAGLISAYDGRPDRPHEAYFDSLKYELEDGLMFIEVRINGRKGRALIDTGSNLTYVNSAFSEHARMRTDLEKTQILQGATGGDESVQVATARKVQIGGFKFENADLFVSDPVLFDRLGLRDEPIMVIGLDVLSAFTVQFDRKRNRLVLILPDTTLRGVRYELMARDTRLGASP